LNDFELLRPLGEGSFGQVFLARQQSLGRLVAIKVTRNQSSEARTLASLEHDHIIRVFFESVDRERGLRVLCMQYVPGPTLAGVIAALGRRPRNEWSGQALLEVIDALSPDLVSPDSTSTSYEREFLAGCNFIEAVCWIGARLAEALAHAHRQGILHRDIKPANILFHRNGRPLLADFNLAIDQQRLGQSGEETVFGGTPYYMAPEHLDAFNPEEPTTPEAVEQRSDLYSLGVVLFELLTGRRPFGHVPRGQSPGATLRALAAERRQEAPSPRTVGSGDDGLHSTPRPDLPEFLDRVVRRCLDPDPARRYQTAAELAQVLQGCYELEHLHKAMPAAGPLTRTTRRYPLFMGVFLPLLPHLVGTLVVFSYTAAWVASHPARLALEVLFGKLALGYSLMVFPITGTLTYLLSNPIWQTYGQLRGASRVDPALVFQTRQRALRKPAWGLALSCLGWVPGALVLPLLVVLLAPEATGWDVFLHYFLSFVIAGLIALTYTEFVDQFLLLCVIYPVLWVDPRQPRQTARAELGPVDRRLRVFQVLSGLIPLATGMALMGGLVWASPEQRASSGYQDFLLLVTVLMGLGLAGFWLAVLISGHLSRALAALQG
jgi:serine/threonine protein kinase